MDSNRKNRNTADHNCRSLICDNNGIIIAEMVYRCMICSNITESISDAKSHYHNNHIDSDLDVTNGGSGGNSSDEPLNFQDDCGDFDESDYSSALVPMSYNHQRNSNQRTSMPRSMGSPIPAHSRPHHSPNRTNRTTTPSTNPPSAHYHHSSRHSSHFNHFNDTPASIESTGSQEPSHREREKSGKRGKISGKPIPPEKANSIKIETSGTNGTCTIKSGYITCPVCSCTKFYTTLQRRYGQFSCVGCYRFFKEFFVKPKRYGCPHLGSCPLDQRTKCKACWIKKCIDVYTVDESRRELLVAHRPLKKNGPKSPVRVSSNGSSELLAITGGEVGEMRDSNAPGTVIDMEDHESNNNNNNLSSSDHDDAPPPPKVPKLILSRQAVEEEEGGEEEAEEMREDEPEHHYLKEEEKEEDSRLQENSLEIDQEEGNSLDDAEELPLDDNELMLEASADEGRSLLLPSGSGYDPSLMEGGRTPPRRKTSGRIKNWCCLKCTNCLADDCGKCINCLDRPKFGGPFIRKQRCLYKKCLMKAKAGP